MITATLLGMEETMSKKRVCALTAVLSTPYFFGIGLVVGRASAVEFPVVRALVFAVTAAVMSAAGVFVLMCDSDPI
jgi:hypothetical protein